ncbi:MAG: hypothetical protein QXU82_00930 [Candidatus Aenigmatarchaeota archaeon]
MEAAAFKGYFLGVAEESKDRVTLCFRDSATGRLHFGSYSGWHPAEIVIANQNEADYYQRLLVSGLARKNGDSIIFKEPPKIMDAAYGKDTERPYWKNGVMQYFRTSNIGISVVLENHSDRNALLNEIRERKVSKKSFVSVIPDGVDKRSLEEAFYEDEEMIWQGEYDVSSGEQIGSTPDGSPIMDIISKEYTGKKNRNIGIMAFDIESDVKDWRTATFSMAGWVPTPGSGTHGKSVLRCYIYADEKTDAKEFKKRHIDENEKYAGDVERFDLKKTVICCEDIRDMYRRIGKDLQKDFTEWCDVFAGYNNKSYDQREMYRETATINEDWKISWESQKEELAASSLGKAEFVRLKSMEIRWKEKGGYDISFRPTEFGVELVMPFTWNHDIYREVNKKRILELQMMPKRLGNIEALLGLEPERETELRGLQIWKVFEDADEYPGAIIHNRNDVISTNKIAKKITVPSKTSGDFFGG